MRSLVIHVIAYAMEYTIKSVLFLGFIGVFNRLVHKPFFYRWRGYLSFITALIVSGWLFDPLERSLFNQTPRSLHGGIGGVLLHIGIGGIICLAFAVISAWVYVRYLHPWLKLKQLDTSAE